MLQRAADASSQVHVFYDHQAFTAQRVGGVSRYFCEVISRLPAYDVQADVFYGLNWNEYAQRMAPGVGVNVPPLPRTYRVRRLVNKWTQIPYLAAIRPEVIHKTFYAMEWLPADSKLVITIHDMIHEAIPHHDPAVAKAKQYWCARADHIMAVSQATCDDLMRIYSVPARKVSVVHLGRSVFQDKAKAEPPIRDEFILYVGTRSAYKNFAALAAAYAGSDRLRRQYRLLCFGGGPLTASEVSQIRAYGITDEIIHCEGSDDLLCACYQHAKAFVYPSLMEGFGLPLVEAMSLGCPVFCSDIPPFREVAGDAAMYFDPASVPDIRLLLERNILERGRLLESGSAGVDRSRRFSWDRCAKETAEIYHALARS
jgi:glycosyltransferase involved in cell wall biosynthesis